jgi:hypothetical protein
MNDTPGIKAETGTDGSRCGQMRRTGEGVEVRDGKDPNGTVRRFTPRGTGRLVRRRQGWRIRPLPVPRPVPLSRNPVRYLPPRTLGGCDRL